MLQRFLLLWLVAVSGLAYFWTDWFPDVVDVFGVSIPRVLHPLVAVTMFAIGLMLPIDEVRQVVRRWPAVLGGTAIQFTTMPLLAFAVAKLGGLQGADFVGVIVVGCVPGAMASNVLTLNARGNTSYSVSLTTAATLLSPVAVPLTLAWTLAEQVDREILLAASLMLLWTVVLPVVAGHLLTRWASRFTNWRRHCGRYGAIVANVAILLIIAAVVGKNREQLFESRWDLAGLLLLVNAGGYVVGYVGGLAMRLPEPMRRALTIEIGMQNAGLGVLIATKLFPQQPTAAIAPAMYTFGCMLTGTALAWAWSRRSAAGVNSPATPPPGPD